MSAFWACDEVVGLSWPCGRTWMGDGSGLGEAAAVADLFPAGRAGMRPGGLTRELCTSDSWTIGDIWISRSEGMLEAADCYRRCWSKESRGLFLDCGVPVRVIYAQLISLVDSRRRRALGLSSVESPMGAVVGASWDAVMGLYVHWSRAAKQWWVDQPHGCWRS